MNLILLLLLFLSFFLIGDKICTKWRLSFSESSEKLIICTAVGLVAVSWITTLLAFLGLIYPATIWAVPGVVCLGHIKKIPQLFNLLYYRIKTASRAVSMGWFDLFNLIVLGILFFCALTLTQTPPTRTDTLVYHLAIPKAYLEHHGIVNLPNNLYSFFPLQIEMLFLFCLALGGETLAKLSGLGMLFLLLAAMTLFYKRKLSRRYVTLVPVLFFATPTFFELSTTAYVDLALAGFMFLVYYTWDRMQADHAWIYPLALFAGATAATKLTAGIVIPLALIGILQLKQSSRDTLKFAAILLFGVLLFLLPWWAKNYYYSGNPFVPLLMEIFGGEDRINWDANRSVMYEQFIKYSGMGHGIKEFFLLPVNLTFFSEKDGLRFDGQIGVLYFLLLPGLFFPKDIAARKDLVRLTFVFVVLLVFWFIQFQYVRFLTPAFTALTLLLTYGFSRIMLQADQVRSKVFSRHAIPLLVSLGIMYNLSLIVADWNRAKPLPYLLGQQSREEYLAAHIPVYPMYQALNQRLNKDDLALFVFMRNFGYLSERNFIADTLFEAHTLQTILGQNPSSENVLQQFRSRRITHLMFDNNYVFGKNSAFTGGQLEVLRALLNSHAKLIERKNDYFLYRFVID